VAAPVKLNFKIYQGSTFREVLRWESSTKKYTPITAISKTAPIVITAPEHSCPLGWRAKVTGVAGMKEINNSDIYHLVTEVTEDTVTFNSINATQYNTYTSGGILEYNAPVPLNGYSAKMQIRSKLSSPDVLLELNTQNGGIVIDTELNTISIIALPSITAELDFDSGIYSLELISGQEVVPFCIGNISLIKEVTR
jgi:hypothetical protein